MIAAAGTAETDAATGRVAGLGAGGLVASPGLFARLRDWPGRGADPVRYTQARARRYLRVAQG